MKLLIFLSLFLTLSSANDDIFLYNNLKDCSLLERQSNECLAKLMKKKEQFKSCNTEMVYREKANKYLVSSVHLEDSSNLVFYVKKTNNEKKKKINLYFFAKNKGYGISKGKHSLEVELNEHQKLKNYYELDLYKHFEKYIKWQNPPGDLKLGYIIEIESNDKVEYRIGNSCDAKYLAKNWDDLRVKEQLSKSKNPILSYKKYLERMEIARIAEKDFKSFFDVNIYNAECSKLKMSSEKENIKKTENKDIYSESKRTYSGYENEDVKLEYRIDSFKKSDGCKSQSYFNIKSNKLKIRGGITRELKRKLYQTYSSYVGTYYDVMDKVYLHIMDKDFVGKDNVKIQIGIESRFDFEFEVDDNEFIRDEIIQNTKIDLNIKKQKTGDYIIFPLDKYIYPASGRSETNYKFRIFDDDEDKEFTIYVQY